MAPKPAPALPGTDPAKLYVWVKALETKVNSLLREVDILKTDLIRKNNQLTKDLKLVNTDVLEVKQGHEQTLQKMDLIIKELQQTAGAEEVMTLKKYVELWNPLHFVTQRDLDRALDARKAAKEINKEEISS